MNSFIRHITGPGERITLLARLHWIYVVKGMLWLLSLAGLGLFFDMQLRRHAGATVPPEIQEMLGIYIGPGFPLMMVMLGSCGTVIFFMELTRTLATEIALTNQRLIYKTGLIFVQVEEIDLEEIRAEHVNHGVLGRFLGYGSLYLDSRFVGDINLPAIRKPYRLIKAMHAMRGRIRDPLVDGAVPASVAQVQATA